MHSEKTGNGGHSFIVSFVPVLSVMQHPFVVEFVNGAIHCCAEIVREYLIRDLSACVYTSLKKGDIVNATDDHVVMNIILFQFSSVLRRPS